MQANAYRKMKFALEAGESLTKALRGVGGSQFTRVADKIEKGDSLADAARQAGVPRLDQAYLAIGESTGRLESAFERLIFFYDVRRRYDRKLLFVLLRSLAILTVGVLGSVGLFHIVEMDIMLWMKVWYVIAYMVLGFFWVLATVVSPGFRGWGSAVSLEFCVASGLSFVETKSALKDAGMTPRMGATQFAGLISLSAEDRQLVSAAEETGKLEEALNRVSELAFEQVEVRLAGVERTFYYGSVILVMGTVLASLGAFAVAGFLKKL